jgi:hypothetical protein
LTCASIYSHRLLLGALLPSRYPSLLRLLWCSSAETRPQLQGESLPKDLAPPAFHLFPSADSGRLRTGPCSASLLNTPEFFCNRGRFAFRPLRSFWLFPCTFSKIIPKLRRRSVAVPPYSDLRPDSRVG